ncbi:MAG: hypothetical protein L3J74_03930 [Bacteroidales bacterium]|nr:hypothetical protein [Bacteroidales bacterium]
MKTLKMLHFRLLLSLIFLSTLSVLNAQPNVTSLTTNLNPITDADNGSNFTVTVVFDQNMNTTINPTISFPIEDPSLTISTSAQFWSSATTYVETFNISDANQELANIDISVSGAQDPLGNLQNNYTQADVFSIDMLQPTVTNVASNLATIADANAGNGTFSISVTFSEALNTGIAPTIAFNTAGEDPVAAGVLSNPSGAWSGGNTVYTLTYDVTDNGTDMFNVDVDVSGAQDAAGNTQAANYDANNLFSIKLSNPTVTLATTNLTTITDANAGAGTFSITLSFSETMDGVNNPVISFPDAGAQTTLITNSNSWNGAVNQFTLAYTVTDNNENIANIDIRAINARDTYGNLMQQYDELDKFNMDMQNPAVIGFTASANPITDANAGTATFTFTIDFNENMNTGVNPAISFPTAGEDPSINTMTFNSGTWSSATQYIASYDVFDADELISNIDVRVTTAQDAAGNTLTQYDNANYLNVDMQNPTVSSISTNLNPIVDTDAGSNFTITIIYSENMNTGVAPTISFPAENPGSTLSFTSGTWTNNTTYVATYSITDNDQLLTNIDIATSGARDVAGNTQVANTQVDVFSIDMVAPTVTAITPVPVTITDANTGANNFVLTIDYSEAMNTGTNPTVSFPTVGEDPTATITFSSGVWNTTTQYVATYNVTDNNDNILNIDVQVSGAADAAGNIQTSPLSVNIFSIDMSNATVTSVTPNVGTITDGNVGTGTFTLTVVYDKNMNTGVNPAITFPTAGEDPLANTLVFNSGTWTNATTYVASYDVLDANETILNIDIDVSGAQDAAGNTQTNYSTINNFNIDTQNPSVSSITTNLNPITEADAGSNFTITVLYDEDMDTGTNPAISFPVENPVSTLSFSSGAWLADNRTYVATYSITDADQEMADIDIQASGARDLNNNTQVVYTSVNTFSIDMATPYLNLVSITSNNVNNTSLAKSGDIITISFTANETLSALPTATIAGQTATVTNTGGLNYTATRTLDGSETEGLCNFNIAFSDAAGNPNTATNTDITDASSVTIDFTAPNNQDAVFSPSVTQYGGSAVAINSSGDSNNKVWFAPAGQTAETDFTAGPTMTQAANGTAASILAPANEGTYYIYVIDEAGNVSLPSTATLTVNNVPQLANIETGALRYVEGDGQVAITSTIDVFDDLNNIVSATIQISGNYQNGEDVLAFVNTVNITGNWDVASGTLTLSGADTKANYQAALRSVTYENTSATPSNLTRTVSFTINDGTYNSNTETRDINLTPVLTVPGDYPSIQIAIDNAINGDRIVVASGTFTENINFNGKEIEIIGNGPGNSIIDGGAAGSVVTFANGESANCLLRGFTIRNGTGTNINLALPYGPQTNYGGGIFINGASPGLENLIVENNSVAIDGENGGSGGGLYIGNGSNVQLNNVTVRNNTASRYQGGGMTIENSSVTFNTVTITNNTTGNYGGGISARNANLDFTDLTITGNSAPGPNGMGGGMFLINCTINFNNVISNSNTANIRGNGICTYSTPMITMGTPNNITDQYTPLD